MTVGHTSTRSGEDSVKNPPPFQPLKNNKSWAIEPMRRMRSTLGGRAGHADGVASRGALKSHTEDTSQGF